MYCVTLTAEQGDFPSGDLWRRSLMQSLLHEQKDTNINSVKRQLAWVISACPVYCFYNWARLIWCWLHLCLDSAFYIDPWAYSVRSRWGLLSCKNTTNEVRANLVVYNSVKVWGDIIQVSGRKHLASVLTPVSKKGNFSTCDFNRWKTRGMKVHLLF